MQYFGSLLDFHRRKQSLIGFEVRQEIKTRKREREFKILAEILGKICFGYLIEVYTWFHFGMTRRGCHDETTQQIMLPHMLGRLLSIGTGRHQHRAVLIIDRHYPHTRFSLIIISRSLIKESFFVSDQAPYIFIGCSSTDDHKRQHNHTCSTEFAREQTARIRHVFCFRNGTEHIRKRGRVPFFVIQSPATVPLRLYSSLREAEDACV